MKQQSVQKLVKTSWFSVGNHFYLPKIKSMKKLFGISVYKVLMVLLNHGAPYQQK